MAGSKKIILENRRGFQGAVPVHLADLENSKEISEAYASERARTATPFSLGKNLCHIASYVRHNVNSGAIHSSQLLLVPNGLGNSNVHWTEKCLLCSRFSYLRPTVMQILKLSPKPFNVEPKLELDLN